MKKSLLWSWFTEAKTWAMAGDRLVTGCGTLLEHNPPNNPECSSLTKTKSRLDFQNIHENFMTEQCQIKASTDRDAALKAARLSKRQISVLKGIASDKSCKQLADELGLAFKSVDNYRQSLKKRLNIKTICGLTHYALKHRIVKNLYDQT